MGCKWSLLDFFLNTEPFLDSKFSLSEFNITLASKKAKLSPGW